jgi:NADPH:quinone reductase-like Zn-dependent oxidoreductase
MKAVRLHGHGGLEMLKYEDAPVPAIRPDEALVRVKAAALNHLDLFAVGGVRGLKLEFPHILGTDLAGVVEEVGVAVAHLRAGDEVVMATGRGCGHCQDCAAGQDNVCREYVLYGNALNGGLAEYCAIRADNLLPKPRSIDWPEAASASLVFLTAWHMLVGRANLRPGETCLVMAAGSGVGIAAIQIAKLLGARVIATSGSDAKLEKAKELGADSVVNYSNPEWPKLVREMTGKRGVEVIVEHTGEQYFEGCVLALARNGRLVTCGSTSGPEAKFDLRFLFGRHLSLLGSWMGSKAELYEVWKFVAAGKLKPVVDTTFALKDAVLAFERMSRREQFGKLVLIPE